MKKSINFTATKNIVTADAYVPYALYAQNKAIVEELGGQVCKGNEGFVAQFPTATKAKEFVSQAICSMSKAEYNKARKTAPAPKATALAPKTGKGKSQKVKISSGDIRVIDGKKYEYVDNGECFVLVPVVEKTTKSAPKKKLTQKATKTVAPTPKKGKGKSCAVDFSKYAGKGRAYNTQAAALIYAKGYKPNSAEFNKAWAVWCEVR
jgi:hypothetical protein